MFARKRTAIHCSVCGSTLSDLARAKIEYGVIQVLNSALVSHALHSVAHSSTCECELRSAVERRVDPNSLNRISSGINNPDTLVRFSWPSVARLCQPCGVAEIVRSSEHWTYPLESREHAWLISASFTHARIEHTPSHCMMPLQLFTRSGGTIIFAPVTGVPRLKPRSVMRNASFPFGAAPPARVRL
jgi:hypothetical protein